MKRLVVLLVSFVVLVNFSVTAHSAEGSSSQIQQLNDQIQNQLKQMQATEQQQIEKLNSQVQAQIKQMQSTLQEQIQKLNAQTQNQMKQMQTTLQQQIKLVHEEVMQNKG